MPPKEDSGPGPSGQRQFGGIELTAQELRDLKEVFDLMDKDKGGTLGLEEVKALMELLGIKVRPDEVEAMIADLDTDGSGQIDFNEFVMVMAKPQDLPYKKADVLRAFRMFVDRDAPTGQISPEALEKALVKYCGGKVPEEEIMRLVNSLELTAEGYIDYQRKVHLFLRS